MGTRQKVVVGAVLVLLVALFVASVGNGAGSGTGSAQEPGGFVRWLGRLFGGPAAVRLAELRSDCLADGVLTVRDTCTVTVARGGEDLRELALRAEQPVTVVSRTPTREEPAEANVAAGDEIRITVDGDGGDIVLTCRGAGGTCVVTLP